MHLFSYLLMFTVFARVVIRLKRSLQDVSNEVCYQFMVSLILPVFAGFFHCPGKNSFLFLPWQKPNPVYNTYVFFPLLCFL